MRKLFFLAGLPRSGSTLLSNILAQNPQLHCSATSPLIGLLNAAAAEYHESPSTIARSAKGECARVLRGIIDGLYAHSGSPFIIDKSRGWAHPHNIALLEEVLGYRPKVLCTVRPIAEVLASFVALMRRNGGLSNMEREMLQLGFALTDDGRCKYLMSDGGPVRAAWSAMKLAAESPFADCLHFVDYDKLCSEPKAALGEIYDFLDVAAFEHDFVSIESRVTEDDSAAYGLAGLHAIRPAVRKQSEPPESVLGKRLFRFYQGGEFWRESASPVCASDNVLTLQVEAAVRGDFDLSRKLLDDADPDDNRAQFNKGWFLLREGRLKDGVALMDKGRSERVFGSPSPSSQPLYRGQPLKGETVLLNLEGGLGDQICGTRWAREITKRGGRAVIACDPSLASTLSAAEGVAAVVETKAAGGVFHQYWLPSMSAPALLELEYEEVDGSAYLPCSNAGTSGGFRVGLRWAGNPEFEHEQHRVFDPAPMFNLGGVTLVSLQKDWSGYLPLHVERPKLDTWEHTAGVIASCDLVISSCTSVAHLAAAAGKPTWIIVPVLPYYLWALPGDTTPWYSSVRLFRQTKYGSWTEPLSRVSDSLDAVVAASARKTA